jgi:hypothetical protein
LTVGIVACLCGMVIALFLIACWRFPKQTGDFISRITSVGASGVKANPPPSPDIVNQEVKDLSRPNIGDELMKLVDNQVIQNSENYIRDTLLPGISPAERESVLARHLAAAWMILAYEGHIQSDLGFSVIHATGPQREQRPDPRRRKCLVSVWHGDESRKICQLSF